MPFLIILNGVQHLSLAPFFYTLRAMQEWADNIWISDAPLKFKGATMTTRMTIIKLSNGKLFVHSPVSINDEIRGEVDALGPVAHIVSPNKFRHLYIGEWAGA